MSNHKTCSKLSKKQRSVLMQFVSHMEKVVIPEIVKTVQRRVAAANEARRKWIF